VFDQSPIAPETVINSRWEDAPVAAARMLNVIWQAAGSSDLVWASCRRLRIRCVAYPSVTDERDEMSALATWAGLIDFFVE